jgi:L-asparaginase
MQRITITTAAPKNPEASILIIYTGGTLGMVYDAQGALVPFDFSQILDRIPSLARFNLQLTVHSFPQLIDSADANTETWQQIGDIISASYDEYDGFVVLHGTDTMAYSASALSFMLNGLNKPVIFTGAQLPIGAVRTDARENLIAALEIASARTADGNPRVPEVCIYFNYRLLRGNRARKMQSIHFDAFMSDNYPLLAEAGVEIQYNTSAILPYRKEAQLQYRRKFDTNVAVLPLFPGISKPYVEAVLHTPALRGLILETYGSGNAPAYGWFIEALQAAVARGLVIINVSQCTGGRVMQGRYHSSRLLEECGVLGGSDISTEAALAKLMLLLGEENSVNEVKNKLIEAQAGEMSSLVL